MPNLPYSNPVRDRDGNRKWKQRNINCPICGNKIITRDPTKVYCSKDCKDEMKRKVARDKTRARRIADAKKNKAVIAELKAKGEWP